MVIESTQLGLISIDIPSGSPFVTDPEGVRDVRSKLGLAIGDAQDTGQEAHMTKSPEAGE